MDMSTYLIKEYPNFILYNDMLTGVKETFQRYDLGLVKEMVKPPKSDLKVEKVKFEEGYR